MIQSKTGKYHYLTFNIIMRGDNNERLYGCWKVLERDKNPKSKSHETFWLCECQNCGAIKSVRKTDLDKNPRSCNNCKGQLTKSCGCLIEFDGEQHIFLAEKISLRFSKLMIIFAASTISLLFVFPIMTMTELISSCSENKK